MVGGERWTELELGWLDSGRRSKRDLVKWIEAEPEVLSNRHRVGRDELAYVAVVEEFVMTAGPTDQVA